MLKRGFTPSFPVGSISYTKWNVNFSPAQLVLNRDSFTSPAVTIPRILFGLSTVSSWARPFSLMVKLTEKVPEYLPFRSLMGNSPPSKAGMCKSTTHSSQLFTLESCACKVIPLNANRIMLDWNIRVFIILLIHSLLTYSVLVHSVIVVFLPSGV